MKYIDKNFPTPTNVPNRIYVSASALAYPRTHRMIDIIKQLNPSIQIIEISNNTPERPKLGGIDLYNYLKETLVICTRSAPYMEIFASPGRISENISVMGKIVSHCPLRCHFCYLDVSGRGTPWTRVYVDIENFYSQAISERLVYKTALTLWSAVSFHQKESFNKVPKGFKEICDSKIRKEFLRKTTKVKTDKDAIRYLKRNLKEFFQQMDVKITNRQTAELKKKISFLYENNSGNKFRVNISEYSDVAGLDPITNQLDELMQLVQDDPGFCIRFRTKTANIQNLLKYEGRNQVQVSFAINTQYVIDRYQEGASSVEDMISAINHLIKKEDYDVEIAIEPIIKYEGYETDYKNLIIRLKNEIDLSKVTKIKIGTVRYKTRLKNHISGIRPNTDLFSEEQQLQEPEKGDKRWRYSKEERLRIYGIILDELASVPSMELGLGSENPELWDELGLNKMSIHEDVVYQYNDNTRGMDE